MVIALVCLALILAVASTAAGSNRLGHMLLAGAAAAIILASVFLGLGTETLR